MGAGAQAPPFLWGMGGMHRTRKGRKEPGAAKGVAQTKPSPPPEM